MSMWDSLIDRLEASEKRVSASLEEIRKQLAAARDARDRQLEMPLGASGGKAK